MDLAFLGFDECRDSINPSKVFYVFVEINTVTFGGFCNTQTNSIRFCTSFINTEEPIVLCTTNLIFHIDVHF